jgi:hypothetical protein
MREDLACYRNCLLMQKTGWMVAIPARGLDNGEILADGPVTEVPLLIWVYVQRRGDETLPAPARALP